MHQFLDYLQGICKKFLFQKKILLTPSYLDGNAFRKSLTMSGFSALNFHITTIFDYAQEVCFSLLLKDGRQILDSSTGQLLVYEILKNLSAEKLLSYFQLPIISPSLAGSIFRTVKEIRVSGYSSSNFPRSLPADSPKMRDLLQILSRYEETVRERKFIDEAELYRLAEKLPIQGERVVFFIPANLALNELELRFFNKKIKPNSFLLQVSYPETQMSSEVFDSAEQQRIPELLDGTVLEQLLQRENGNIPELPLLNIKFSEAYGEYNETREVFRNILKEGYALDQVQIFYTTQEPYSQYFYQLAQLYQIPVTFHSGINVKNSHPAQFLFSLIDWIGDNYSIIKLATILKNSCLALQINDYQTILKYISLFKQSPIGWGRERYIPGIDLAILEKKRRMENTSEEKAGELAQDLHFLMFIREWIKKIFAEIPEHPVTRPISLAQLASGFIRIVNNYALIENSNLDQESAQIINRKLTALEQNSSIQLSVAEALLFIKNALENERINCSTPLPGHLHLASYKKGIWLNRYYTFLVGMNYQKFPAGTEDDTVLVDTEKIPFKHLLRSSEKNRKEQLRLLELVLSRQGQGKIFLSFSGYDTVAQREQAPANLLLHLYRLQKKDTSLDYSTFYRELSPLKGFIPQNELEILDNGELYLYFAQKEKWDFEHFFNQQYGAFQQGIKADRIRREEGFNGYNGKIRVNTRVVDPRENRGIVVSATKLERIAYCPYLYFLIDILKIKPSEEIVYDPTVWLNPLERGLLLHQIYEKFYKILLKNSPGEKIIPSFTRHWPQLAKIVEDSLAEKREYLAPPGELVYEAERKEILDSCRVFLVQEEMNYTGQSPRYFELAFGTRDSNHEVLGKIKALELSLPDRGKISIQGKIDRVDLLPDGTFRIIDYKTGSSQGFTENSPFRQGQQVQHALYALALEKILATKGEVVNATVNESGYYFPTITGQGKFVLYKKHQREQVLEIVKILLDIVAQGSFAMIKEADDYMCLDYQDILEQNETITVAGKKGEKYQNDPSLEEIRRLQQFD